MNVLSFLFSDNSLALGIPIRNTRKGQFILQRYKKGLRKENFLGENYEEEKIRGEIYSFNQN